MKLARYIANLGYGSWREVEAMIDKGRVTLMDGTRLRVGQAAAHEDVLVDGVPLDPPPGVVLMLNKPVGYVSSAKDPGAVVYDLLPPRFALRTPVIAPAGRLDRDTTGLLLLTDDGQLNHRITSPRRHVEKVYEAELAAPLRGHEEELFASGTLTLKGDRDALAPARLEPLTPTRVRMVIREGRYHQVRRMFAAAGNHVVELHRVSVGGLELGDLPPGDWRVLSSPEVDSILRS